MTPFEQLRTGQPWGSITTAFMPMFGADWRTGSMEMGGNMEVPLWTFLRDSTLVKGRPTMKLLLDVP